jgi:hypothetical protein
MKRKNREERKRLWAVFTVEFTTIGLISIVSTTTAPPADLTTSLGENSNQYHLVWAQITHHSVVDSGFRSHHVVVS